MFPSSVFIVLDILRLFGSYGTLHQSPLPDVLPSSHGWYVQGGSAKRELNAALEFVPESKESKKGFFVVCAWGGARR